MKNNLLACWQLTEMEEEGKRDRETERKEQRKAQENGNRLTLSYQYSINKAKYTNIQNVKR